MAEMPVVELEGVERRWGDGGLLVAIESLHLVPGEAAALVGPSGCGKSTCLDLLAFTLRPDRARRFVVTACDGQIHDVAASWAGHSGGLLRLRAREIGYVLQTGALLPYLSGFENTMLSRRLLGLDGEGDLPGLFAALEIAAVVHRRPAQLSVGERQRVAVARALAHGPRLLLADEPTAALDPYQAEKTFALLVSLARDRGCAVLIATHDPELARAAGCRIVPCVVEPGRTAIADSVTA
jgi:putative ABC transport system ATP-binding protein